MSTFHARLNLLHTPHMCIASITIAFTRQELGCVLKIAMRTFCRGVCEGCEGEEKASNHDRFRPAKGALQIVKNLYSLQHINHKIKLKLFYRSIVKINPSAISNLCFSPTDSNAELIRSSREQINFQIERRITVTIINGSTKRNVLFVVFALLIYRNISIEDTLSR